MDASAERPPLLRFDAFGAPHAFTTRLGGVSAAPFETLNLGASVGDDAQAVETNRVRVLTAFGAHPDRVAFAHQVHGARVVTPAEAGGVGRGDVQADALVSDDPEWTLAISMADCLPLLLHDPDGGAVAAVHAGWRGVVAGVVEAAVDALVQRYGASPERLRAAIGPHIHQPAYQVGGEVVDAFREAGFPSEVAHVDAGQPDRYRLSVERAVRFALQRAGVPEAAVTSGGWCTAADETRFYSHRRDAGRTGRHWALVRAT